MTWNWSLESAPSDILKFCLVASANSQNGVLLNRQYFRVMQQHRIRQKLLLYYHSIRDPYQIILIIVGTVVNIPTFYRRPFIDIAY